MSALYLKDLAQKTHRGLEGRVRQGLSAGGIAYGYDIARAIGTDGQPKTGERAINNAQADIVRQIFASFAAGKSPRSIASELNKQHVAGPHGVPWGASTIYGNWRRGTGILNNELYVGRLVWNRQRFVRDPQTGRRQAIPNPPGDWIVEDVPGMRIVDDELWGRVEARQEGMRFNIMQADGIRPERARRPKYLFLGLIKCGACGGGYVATGKNHYACSNVSNRGTCENRLTIRRDVLEESVLSGLRRNLVHPDLLATFMSEYRKEWNRLRREEEAARSRDTVELASIKRQLARIIDAVKNGFYVPSMKAEAEGLEQRKAELEASMLMPNEELPRLHPGVAEIYRRKVEALAHVLNDEALRDEAAGSLRSLLSQTRLVPEGGKLKIELVGELAGILALTNEKSPTAVGKGLQ